MFPIILNNHFDEDDEDLLIEAASNDYFYENSRLNLDNYNEATPLFSDNLRCNAGHGVGRTNNFSKANQSTGERIIEIKSEYSDSDEDTINELPNFIQSTSTGLRHVENFSSTNQLNNDFRFQRFKPIRNYKEDISSNSHEPQQRLKKNYQVLKSKKRFTFPIMFYVGLYIAFLLISSLIFTMFEQKNIDKISSKISKLNLKKNINFEQFELIKQLVRTSILLQNTGLNSLEILRQNDLIDQEKLFSNDLNKIKLIDIKEKQDQNETLNLNKEKKVLIKSLPSHNWNFQQAFFYVVSIATTIGYGNLKPQSDAGKIYTIIFGMIAIPYTTILFSVAVSKFCNGPLRRFKLSLLTKHFKNKNHDTLRTIRLICFILTTFFILFIILGLPAVIFSKIEKNWTYLDGFYFTFISITTTGFGDFVPEFYNNLLFWVYEIIVIIFLYFGILVIMLWMYLIKLCFRKSLTVKLDEADQDEEDRHELILEEQCLLYHYHQKNYVNYGSFYGYDEVSVKLPR